MWKSTSPVSSEMFPLYGVETLYINVWESRMNEYMYKTIVPWLADLNLRRECFHRIVYFRTDEIFPICFYLKSGRILYFFKLCTFSSCEVCINPSAFHRSFASVALILTVLNCRNFQRLVGHQLLPICHSRQPLIRFCYFVWFLPNEIVIGLERLMDERNIPIREENPSEFGINFVIIRTVSSGLESRKKLKISCWSHLPLPYWKSSTIR